MAIGEPFLKEKEEKESYIEKIIKKETNNLREETAIVPTGFNRKNCYKIKKKAEQLGYRVREPENPKYRDKKNRPYFYELRKVQE